MDPERDLARVKKWADANPEKVRAKTARNYPVMKAKSLADSKIRRDVWAARKAVNNAIAARKLKRGCCEVCGEEDAEAHHHSYQREHWFDVKWLCKEHHLAKHKRLRREARKQHGGNDAP